MLFSSRFSFCKRLLLLWGLFTLASVALGRRAVRQAHAQGGNIERQNVSEQMEAVGVGDTVVVVIDRLGYARVEGIVQKQDRRHIVLALPGGARQTFERRIVYAVVPAGAEDKRRREALHLHPDYTSGKLFFLPTARPSDGAGLVVNDPGVLLPYVNVSLPGGFLSLRAGSSALPVPWQYLHAGGKLVLLPLDHISVAVGALGGLTTNYFIEPQYEDEWAGIGWAETTLDFRVRENADGERVGTTGLTLGAGYVKSGSLVGDGIALLGGFEHRYGGNIKLLLEGEYLPAGRPLGGLFPSADDRDEREWITSGGLRYIGSATTLEVGALTGSPLLRSGIPAVPIISFSLKVF